MPQALMMGVTQHQANSADPSQIDLFVTFRLAGTAANLGTIDATATVVSSDTPVGVLGKIKTAIISRAAEYGVTLAANDVNPLLFGKPVASSQVLFAQTSVQAGDTIANTASFTRFATKTTLAANSIVAGQVIRVTSGGVFNTPAIGTRSLDNNLLLGGNGLLGTGTRSPSLASASNSPWTMQANIICTAAGASGTAEGNAIWTFFDNALSEDDVWTNATNVGFVFDTTIANDVELGVTWTSASASNSITMRHLTVAVAV